MEKIIGVAIQYKENSRYRVIRKNAPARHCDLYEALFLARVKYTNVSEGFFTAEKKFVDRFEAYDIALAANQIINPEATRPLYSEDLW